MRTYRTLRVKNAHESGTTLIETMVALAILLIVATGLMTVAGIAVTTTETQGHLAARTAEYAQDKMEQLLALKFGDNTSNTAPAVGFITTNVGGSGLAPGGSLSTTAPVAQYVDYLDISGNPVGAAANWEYVRVWQVTSVSGTLKQISVRTQVRNIPGNGGRLPESTVVAYKASAF
jgi:type II secretory pathway pseudopilin PulG